MALNAEVFRMIPPICLGRVPVECAVPPRPSPAARIGLGTAAPTPRTRPLAPPRQGAHPRNPARESDPAGGRTSPRRIRPPNREGYSAGGGAGAGVGLLVWWQFPRGRRRVHGGALLLGPLKFRWTICVPLDHLRSVGPLACGWTTCVRLDHLRAVGPPYFVNQVVQRNASGPTAFKWSKQASRVTTCETPSHHAGRPVGRSRCGTPEPPRRPAPPPGSRVLTTRASRTAPDDRTADPAAPDSPNTPRGDSSGSSRPAPLPRAPTPSTAPRITPGKRIQTPRTTFRTRKNHSSGTSTTFTHALRLQSHPLNNLLGTAMAPQSRKGSLASSSSSDWGTRISS